MTSEVSSNAILLVDLECHHHSAESGYCVATRLRQGNRGGDKMPMLVGIRKIADFSGPITTETRLQPLDRCLMNSTELVEPHFAPLLGGRAGSWEVMIPT